MYSTFWKMCGSTWAWVNIVTLYKTAENFDEKSKNCLAKQNFKLELHFLSQRYKIGLWSVWYPWMNIQNHVSDVPTNWKHQCSFFRCLDRNLCDLNLGYKSDTETVSSLNEHSKSCVWYPQSENINVHALDVSIEIFKIWSWVTCLTKKLFLPKMNIQNHVSNKHPKTLSSDE